MFTWTFNNLIGFRPRATPVPAVPPKAPAETTGLAPNPHLAARRAQALRSMFPKLSSWCASQRDSLMIGEINDYLAQASNVTELEQRIRVIERQRHFS